MNNEDNTATDRGKPLRGLPGEMEKKRQNDVELLTFRKGDAVAMVVTDGHQTRTFTAHDCRAHGSLKMAIAYLESAGYDIDTSAWGG